MMGIGPVLSSLFAPFRRDFTFAGYFVGISIRIIWLFATSIFLAGGFTIIFSLALSFYLAPVLMFLKRPFLLLPYFAFWLFYYVMLLWRQKYWEAVKQGQLNQNLRFRIWRRLALNPEEVEKIFLQNKEKFIQYLKKRELNEEDFLFAKDWVLRKEYRKQSWKFWRDEFFVRRKGVNIGWVAGFLPELKKFSVDLTQQAAQGLLPHIFGREREVEKILSTLGRPKKNNVLLVGPAGVGKTSLAYSIAWLIIGRRVDLNLPMIEELVEPLEGNRLIELNTGGMVGGTSFRGSLEARFSEVLRELKEGETILFINMIENLVQAGLIGYLTPLLASSRFPILATITPKKFEELVSQASEFVSEFEVVKLDPPGITETVWILEGVANELESRNPVFFSYPALVAAVELSERYIHDSVLPEKAINVLVKAVKISEKGFIKTGQVETAVSSISGVPVGALSSAESEKLLNLEQLLKRRIVGQDEGIREIARAIRRARTGVGSKERPIASLLFLGPTGVGKTLTAKTLAQVYFSAQSSFIGVERMFDKLIEKNFVRFDMSEFSEYGAVTTFIERITQEIKDKPFSLLLLDEFEKAENHIHNLFLQIFEDGRLTSETGQTIDFRNTIIIATSNAVQKIPEGKMQVEELLRDKLEEFFRPELINRFDGIVVFHILGKHQMHQIVILELRKVRERLKKEYEIELSWTQGLVDELTELGYDPEYGARPLRRVIQNRLEDTLAQRILRKELQPGDSYEMTVNDLQ